MKEETWIQAAAASHNKSKLCQEYLTSAIFHVKSCFLTALHAIALNFLSVKGAFANSTQGDKVSRQISWPRP